MPTWDVHQVPTTGSTNADVAAAARDGAAEGYAVVTSIRSVSETHEPSLAPLVSC